LARRGAPFIHCKVGARRTFWLRFVLAREPLAIYEWRSETTRIYCPAGRRRSHVAAFASRTAAGKNPAHRRNRRCTDVARLPPSLARARLRGRPERRLCI